MTAMVFPLSDSPNPRGVPIVTYAIIAANCAVYLFLSLPLSGAAPDPNDPALAEYVQVLRETLPPQVSIQSALRGMSAYDLYVYEHGYKPGAPEVSDLLVSVFLHGGFMHLFGNMLFLWIYGDNVEYRLGRLRYLFYYLLTGVVATLFFSLFALGSRIPLVGASGAISGVLGFYFVWFPHNSVRVFFFLFPFLMRVVELPARLVLGFYLFLDNVLPFLVSTGGGGGVAHGAHIGGFVAGLAIAWLMDRKEAVAAPAEYRHARPVDAGAAVTDALAAGNFERAATGYFALPADQTRRLLRPADSLALADWLENNGHDAAALAVYRRHLRDYPAGPGAGEAHLGAGLALLREGQPASAYQHLLDALDADPAPETAARAREALAAIQARQKLRLARYPG
jgi:membrane associated rhomboid family serine protease